MKICWDNLKGLTYNKEKGLFSKQYINNKGLKKFLYLKEKGPCEYCGEMFLSYPNSKGKYCDLKCGYRGTNPLKYLKLDGKNNPSWKGGYCTKNIPRYDIYAERLKYIEKVRRNPADKNILQVKCVYCGQWYTPNIRHIINRVASLEGRYSAGSEHRFYCSENCKQACPIYMKHVSFLMKEDAIRAGRLHWLELNREVQPELRQMVFQRDGYKCTKCDLTGPLHCHHIEGIRWAPIESADMDGCITVCVDCHKEIHKKDGCKPSDMRCPEYLKE